ncbi:MAG TPA: hypothetical protein G4N94_06770 [Caldilineae bacterium]|nr:hypothetical protein [Caldilineae bacterium]
MPLATHALATWLHPPQRGQSIFVFVLQCYQSGTKTTTKNKRVEASTMAVARILILYARKEKGAVAEAVDAVVGMSKMIVAHIVQMPGGCLLDLHIGDISEA